MVALPGREMTWKLSAEGPEEFDIVYARVCVSLRDGWEGGGLEFLGSLLLLLLIFSAAHSLEPKPSFETT